MPIREYKCGDKKCENYCVFEYLHLKVGEEPLTYCPECGHPVTLLMSSSNAILVGEGFYQNDYRKDTKKKEKKKEVTKVKEKNE